jgi:hypothetical protein
MASFSKNSILFSLVTSLLYIFLTGCQSSAKRDDNENKTSIKNAISAYCSVIHSIQLPIKDTCDDTIAIQKVSLPDSLTRFNKYGQLLGKINESKNYTAILYAIPADIQLPVLRTFDKDGKEIASLKLFIGNCCGENEDCSGSSTFHITKELQIILKDSVQTFERDKKNLDKKKNTQTLIKQEEFKIDSLGNIRQIKPVA